MPHLFNDVVVVTEKEILETGFFKSSKSFRDQSRNMNKRNDVFYKKAQRGARGQAALYEYGSLPQKVKGRFSFHVVEPFYQKDVQAKLFFQLLLGIKSKLNEKYLVNAEVLAAAIRLKAAREAERRSMSIPMKKTLESVVYDIQEFNRVLQEKYGVRHTLPKSLPRFRSLMNEFLKPCEHPFNYACLLSGKLGNSNKTAKAAKMPEPANEWSDQASPK